MQKTVIGNQRLATLDLVLRCFQWKGKRWGGKITSGTWVRVVPPPEKGATVLHCLARLCGIAIQGATKVLQSATQGATFFTALGSRNQPCVGLFHRKQR